MTQPSFTPKSLSFLRSLKRNNDREWFRARKDDYERHVRAPMVAVIERLAVDFGRFAPELDASPKRCIYRIYRDTRFSGDKTPLKTQIAASFRWRGLPRGRSAGLYFEVHPRMGVDGRRLLRAGDPSTSFASVSTSRTRTLNCTGWRARPRSVVRSPRSRATGCRECRAGSQRMIRLRPISGTGTSWPAASSRRSSRRRASSIRRCSRPSRPRCRLVRFLNEPLVPEKSAADV